MPRTVLVLHSWKVLTDHVANGDGLFAYGLLRRLAERGHRLHVACRAVELRTPPPDGLILHRLSTQHDHLGGAERLRYMRRLRALYRRLAASERVELVHQPNPVDAGVSLALPRHAPPLVLGPYWADWPQPDADLRGRLARGARRLVRTLQQRRAEAVTITTEAARAKVHVSALARHATLVPPGVDLADFPPLPERDRGGAPTVLFLANLRLHKGILTLVDAWPAVVARAPGARLLIVGAGPDEAAVRAHVAASPAAAGIELRGAVEPREVPGVMAAADVFCQPAHGEPFGWSAVEAMARGLPVVATNTGGLGSVVPDAAGRKVPPHDPAALAGALAELLGDPSACAAMGAAGRAHVERVYAWDHVVDRLEAVYETAAASRGSA